MVSNQHVFVPQGLDMLCHSSLSEQPVYLISAVLDQEIKKDKVHKN